MRNALNFGAGAAGLVPVVNKFVDLNTLAAITPPVIYEVGNGVFYFDFSFPIPSSPNTTAVLVVVTCNSVQLMGTLTPDASTFAPSSPAGASTAGGSMTLARLRERVRSEADIENDPHITDSELNDWINSARFELYDLLITRFGEDYYISKATITVAGGETSYPLPDGTLYGGADSYYKGAHVEAMRGPSIVPGKPVTLRKFNLREKNSYNLPQAMVVTPFTLPRYRINGSNIIFMPPATGGMEVQLWYAPRLVPLVSDNDVAEDWSGWLELVVIEAVIRAINKQERDVTPHMLRKAEWRKRIELAAQHRDLGDPNTISETYGDGMYGGPYGWGPGFGGLW